MKNEYGDLESKISQENISAEKAQPKRNNVLKNKENSNTTSPKTASDKPKSGKVKIIALIITLCIIVAVAAITIIISIQKAADPDKLGRVEFPDPIYSNLSGLEIADESINSMPTYCIQIPNGDDGGRPQAGLDEAVVVFEAIAEAGITRFAAIYQNPTVSAIGPVRSLRPYYLDWDTPFDCTVTHAGGSDEALAAIRSGGQRDHDENYTYMWRELNSGRLWNNLFTSSALLAQHSSDNGYTTSSPKTFPRYTPFEVEDILTAKKQATEECEQNGTCNTPTNTTVSDISITIGQLSDYNPVYHYNSETNSYDRSYASGTVHISYHCDAELNQPNTKTACGSPQQLSPNVVIAMTVRESRMSDNYHENITTLGSGNVVIFQNGEAITGTWKKSSQSSQIEFYDEHDNIIKLTPGQVWITAVPQYGSVSY